MGITPRYIRDLAERVGWTAAEAGVAFVAVEAANWQGEWVPVIATLLAVAKGIIARHVGKPNSAAIGA